jgi:ech hydrogenase subunit A
MVKAGVYLLIRLAPAMSGTYTGNMVAFIGGFTFLATSMLAISQYDGKKVLAYSTISNLGLITACTGIGKPETVWAAVFLLIFHAVSKSMLFQTVGAIENATGSRDIESMQSLIVRLPRLCYATVLGIAGMFLAPFGMLISKWAALKAFVDVSDILLIIFIVYGSATTMFYWTKWLSKLLARRSADVRQPVDKTKKNEIISIYTHAVLMVLLCGLFPLLSRIIVEPIVNDINGTAKHVLSDGNLYIMIVLLASVFILPSMMYIFARKVNTKKIYSYMSGINTGTNTSFVDSFGGCRKLTLSNWYMTDWFGEKRLLPPSLVISALTLAGFLIIIITGGIA